MLSLSIIIATYNRAAMINDTLAAMAAVDRDGIDAEWIVVNNNSTDETGPVLFSFRDRLPIKILNEGKPGKNAALNKALREANLRDIVVFSDDDTSPRRDWLRSIVAACERWPAHEVFGGRIVLRWPNNRQCPEWLAGSWLLSFGFSEHHLGDVDGPYPEGVYPFGPNHWFRKSIFAQGRLFREEIGPKGESRIMGSETSLLALLANEGKEMIYCPGAVVEHRIKPHDHENRVLFRRAYSLGRGLAHIDGIYRRDLLSRRPAVWHARQILKLLVGFSRLPFDHCRIGKRGRMESVCRTYVSLGQTIETSKLVLAQRGKQVRGMV